MGDFGRRVLAFLIIIIGGLLIPFGLTLRYLPSCPLVIVPDLIFMTIALVASYLMIGIKEKENSHA